MDGQQKRVAIQLDLQRNRPPVLAPSSPLPAPAAAVHHRHMRRNSSLQECTPIAYILVNESLELPVLLFEPVQCQMRTSMPGENDRGSFHLYA
jgi:hypothetical protein